MLMTKQRWLHILKVVCELIVAFIAGIGGATAAPALFG